MLMGPPNPADAMGPPNPAEAALPAGMDGLTPELIDQMVALGTLTEEQAMLLRQRQRAEGLAASQMPGGINTRGGFTADSPLSAMGTMLRQYKGNKDLRGYDEREGQILGEMRQGRGALGDILRNSMMTPETDPLAGRAAAPGVQRVAGGGGLLESAPTAPNQPVGPPAPAQGEMAGMLQALRNPMADGINMNARRVKPGQIDFNRGLSLMDILRGAMPGGAR